jgi:4-amino-4-deoxy-L-arabinose transferase-like glycosyltransferase
LFSNLGDAALFEPDEGRNAEVAREIILLKDWVTPHYDFIPRLDKPSFFFDLVALSYKLFGISEWSARLPSVLAALASLSLTYGFTRSVFGRWAALWSALILLTSIEFFALSRVVILDMLLTCFLTAALCCFFLGQRGIAGNQRKIKFLLMYAAMGAATLTKGPIGFLLPGAVIFLYLFIAKRWTLLRHMEIPFGTPLFILIAASWYVLAELRNPGYLHHFLWEENVARFATQEFKRGGPWYYFGLVLTAGFFPWTALLPRALVESWKRSRQREYLFLILWMVVPLVFFSLSSSKLPHYILPIYPALAIIVGTTFANALTVSSAKANRVLWFPAGAFFLLSLVLTLAELWPQFFPSRLQPYLHGSFSPTPFLALAGLGMTATVALINIKTNFWAKPEFLYAATTLGFALFVLFAAPIVKTVSSVRSSKTLAEKSALFIRDADQLVLYGGYPSSLPFYLKSQRPIWVVWSGKKRQVLGSDYIAKKRPEPAPGYGQILWTFEEFAELWKTAKHRFVVFVDRGAVDRFELLVGSPPKILLSVGDTVLIENKQSDCRRNDNRKSP